MAVDGVVVLVVFEGTTQHNNIAWQNGGVKYRVALALEINCYSADAHNSTILQDVHHFLDPRFDY